jgi:hypothetical protein
MLGMCSITELHPQLKIILFNKGGEKRGLLQDHCLSFHSTGNLNYLGQCHISNTDSEAASPGCFLDPTLFPKH